MTALQDSLTAAWVGWARADLITGDTDRALAMLTLGQDTAARIAGDTR